MSADEAASLFCLMEPYGVAEYSVTDVVFCEESK